MITFSDVSKRYNNSNAVRSLDFSINEGEFFVLIGPSGCGKTTTLKMMNRLIDPSSGSIMIEQQEIKEYNIHQLRYQIGYVLQQIALFPHMTIEENISIVPELKKWKQADITNRVAELLELVGLDPEKYRKRKPRELSGGQQQRIGVARALAADPKIILMDEPFSALDPITREKLQDDLLELKNSIRKTIVFVTHDIKEALKLGDRVAVMNKGEIVQIGTKDDLLFRPVNDFVKDFIGTRQPSSQNINLNELMIHNISEDITLTKEQSVSPAISLEELLELLSAYDYLVVEDNNQRLGFIDRQAMITYLANQGAKRGLAHE
ncbi:osmoprotectant transport system ATP-binding protein [Cytobacillus horneckiae]|uniref:Quaternary amine transport ATP-binding protein n=1 Tax=Cytobacillus horneckiae TaxID=549687 RepID=A0A2N0ZNE4_9BACI|nr:ABC transporter ATP-binding protein [Cytobacillus horneckiae]MBN6889367.1 ABC transporter ATP-binding protein [Cytobacillus horneckiae]MCM3179496.1 ABC transporter ATP-binding protein [Cytobacillus horneckiae]MEC1154922.1 ABC transporter ATP-binding protein [Cytobacillus horneckiae]MED2936172.1 ABC transporter ATP-binding protein [Cytobacillus horneckiae]PKG31034.1 glycine/betaine ABC transporter ATP-binding protein [Cytobacillus horneckiae]